MSPLEISLICTSILLVAAVGAAIWWGLGEHHERADAEAREAAWRQALGRANRTIGALGIELDATRRKHAKAEHDLSIACALRPMSIDAPREVA
jgi:hypothetical protein